MSLPFALVLAGGRGSRMGGVAKGLLPLGDKPLLAHVLARLDGQCQGAWLNVADEEAYQAFSLPMLKDNITGFAGPLAGVLAGLDHLTKHYPDETHLLTCSCDAPFLPRDLASRLLAETQSEGLAYASTALGAHPTHALWPIVLRDRLRHALEVDQRAMLKVMSGFGAKSVAFEDTPIDPFFNINTPEDLAKAREWLTLAP